MSGLRDGSDVAVAAVLITGEVDVVEIGDAEAVLLHGLGIGEIKGDEAYLVAFGVEDGIAVKEMAVLIHPVIGVLVFQLDDVTDFILHLLQVCGRILLINLHLHAVDEAPTGVVVDAEEGLVAIERAVEEIGLLRHIVSFVVGTQTLVTELSGEVVQRTAEGNSHKREVSLSADRQCGEQTHEHDECLFHNAKGFFLCKDTSFFLTRLIFWIFHEK